jgi:hypothetical protein
MHFKIHFMRRTLSLFLVALVAAVSSVSHARQAPFVAVDDPMMPFVEAALSEGLAPDWNPNSWPVSQKSLVSWLQESKDPSKWLAATSERLLERLPPSADLADYVHTDLRAGIRLATQDRRDLVRHQQMDELSWQPMLLSRTWFQAGSWTASLGLRFDRYYEVDPDGMDTAHRWFSRAEDAYIARNGEWVDFFFGRMGRHWGATGGTGLQLSQNPRPMDHMSLRLGGDRLFIESVLAELDSFTGDGRATGTAGADSVRSGSIRRMLSTHRLSLAVTNKWTVGLSHSTLYSGANAGFSLKFVNPFNVALYEIDNRPKNDENNGMVGAFFAFRNARTMAHGELLLDDVDVLNGTEPASIAASMAVRRSALAPDLSAGLTATLVTARTYNSEQTTGQYSYLGRGIATQFADYVHVRAFADWMRFPGWIVRGGIDVLRQGEADFRGPLPDIDAATLFTGTPETTIRPFMRVMGLTSAGLDVAAEAGWNSSSDHLHQPGASHSDVTASISVSYRVLGSRSLK